MLLFVPIRFYEMLPEDKSEFKKLVKLISYDYSIATITKRNINDKEMKKQFIKLKNKWNFNISWGLFIIFILGVFLVNKDIFHNLSILFIVIVLIRIVSRLLEIALAFYDDSVQSKKTSSLQSLDRIN